MTTLSESTVDVEAAHLARLYVAYVKADQRFGQRRLQHREQRPGDDGGLRAAVRQHVGVVVGRQQRVHRHRHHARVQRAQEAHHPVAAVVHEQQHALFALQAQRLQRRREALHLVSQLAVGERARVVDQRGLAGAAGVERDQVARDPAWVHQPGGPLQLPPLLAVTHSSLARLPAFADRLQACAALLLEAGADANQRVGSRWPPASLQAPDAAHPLSALYGAAGAQHHAGITRLLLDAGASPNDGESLYHALGSLECTRLLLEAGARVPGTNALHRVLDLGMPSLPLSCKKLNLFFTWAAAHEKFLVLIQDPLCSKP
mgnify:CR=1 FL=1